MKVRLAPHERGAAVVEFALLLPLLVALLAGAADLARLAYHQNVLAKSVREAARYLSTVKGPNTLCVYPTDANWGGRTTDVVARNITVYGDPRGTGEARLPGLASSQVLVTVGNCSDESPNPQLAQIGFSDASGRAQGTMKLVRVKVQGYRFTPALLGWFDPAPGITTWVLPDISATFELR